MGMRGGNGKVFISHTQADRERCQPLLAALDAWNVDYWFDAEQIEAGERLADRIQQALLTHDIFLRICTAAARASFWMRQERDAFLGLQATEFTPSVPERRRLIALILEDGYVLEPFERAAIYIDATQPPDGSGWLSCAKRWAWRSPRPYPAPPPVVSWQRGAT